MSRAKIALLILAVIAGSTVIFIALRSGKVALLNPKGAVAGGEHALIATSIALMLIIVVPVLVLLYTFAWKYRSGNQNAKYDPENVHGPFGEIVLWVIPAILIAILGTLTWRAAHALDPYKPIESSAKPLTIQVVALEWKWLFIYPEQHIATVNFIEFPEKTPVHFELTADAPMSSFWIPELGSQIYAMSAMQTQLYLMASSTGEYTGKDTEINGRGYAGMTFTAKSVSNEDFGAWVASVKQSPQTLTGVEYAALEKPSEDNPPAYYSSVANGLYGKIVMTPMMPSSSEMTSMDSMPTAPAASTGTMPMDSGTQNGRPEINYNR